MKKILIAIAAIFILNFGCKKITDGGGICACSPLPASYLSLVIKNTAQEDLLDAKITGAFTPSQIKLYAKDANGVIKQIAFIIRQPFSYGSDQFKYFQLLSYEAAAIATNNTVIYLTLGNNAPFELKLQRNTNQNKIDRLLINDKEAVTETGKVTSYNDGNIFYLTL